MEIGKINKKLYYVGHPDHNDSKAFSDVIKEMNKEIEQLKASTTTNIATRSGTFCECGGSERVALDCTMKPCKHPKYNL